MTAAKKGEGQTQERAGGYIEKGKQEKREGLEKRVEQIKNNLELLQGQDVAALKKKLAADLASIEKVLKGDSRVKGFTEKLEKIAEKLVKIEGEIEKLLSSEVVGEKKEGELSIEKVLMDALKKVEAALKDKKLITKDDSSLGKKCKWVLLAVKNALDNRDEDGLLDVSDGSGGSQKEGIPVDNLIEALNELSKKSSGEQAIQLKELAKILEDSSQGYFETHPEMVDGSKQNWRTTLEAKHISSDDRKTGSMDDDYKKAMGVMSKRRELVLPRKKQGAGQTAPESVVEEPKFKKGQKVKDIVAGKILTYNGDVGNGMMSLTNEKGETFTIEKDFLTDLEAAPNEPEETVPAETVPEVEPAQEDVKPEEPPVKPEFKERGKTAVDIPVSLMKEIMVVSGIGEKIIGLVAINPDKQAIKKEIKNIFDNLGNSQQDALKKTLERCGYTLEEFLKVWKESAEGTNSVADSIVDALQAKFEVTRRNHAQEMITLKDQMQVNWRSIVKRALLVAGVAGAAAITGGVALGAFAGVGAGIAAGGVAGRFLGRRDKKGDSVIEVPVEGPENDAIETGGFFKRLFGRKKVERKQLTDSEMMDRIAERGGLNAWLSKEAAKQKIEEKAAEYEERLVAEMAEEIKKQGIGEYLGSLISQGILEVTSGNVVNANSELLKSKVVKRVVEQLESEGNIDAAQKEQLNNLLEQLSVRKNLGEAAKEVKASPAVIRIVEGFMKLKSGTIDLETDSNIKNIAAYLAPMALGGSIIAAGALGGGVVTEAVRLGLVGVAGGYGGYRFGEKMDQRAQKEAVIKEIKNIMADVEERLNIYKQGSRDTALSNQLKADIRALEGHIKIGSLDHDVILKTRAEALVREGEREIFVIDKEDQQNLGSLIKELTEHNTGADTQAAEDVKRITKQTKNWRRWVYGIGGAVGSAAAALGITEIFNFGGSKILHGDHSEIKPMSGMYDKHGNVVGGFKYEDVPHAKYVEPVTGTGATEHVGVTPAPKGDVVDTVTSGRNRVGGGMAHTVYHRPSVSTPSEQLYDFRDQQISSMEVDNANKLMEYLNNGTAHRRGIEVDFPANQERAFGLYQSDGSVLDLRHAGFTPDKNGVMHVILENGKKFDAKVSIDSDGTFHLIPPTEKVSVSGLVAGDVDQGWAAGDEGSALGVIKPESVPSNIDRIGNHVVGTERFSLSGDGVNYVNGQIGNVKQMPWDDMQRTLLSGENSALMSEKRTGSGVAEMLRELGTKTQVVEHLPTTAQPAARAEILSEMKMLLEAKLGHKPSAEEMFQNYNNQTLERMGLHNTLDTGTVDSAPTVAADQIEMPAAHDVPAGGHEQTLEVAGRRITVAGLDQQPPAVGIKILGVTRAIEAMPDGPAKQAALDRFADVANNPTELDKFAKGLGVEDVANTTSVDSAHAD